MSRSESQHAKTGISLPVKGHSASWERERERDEREGGSGQVGGRVRSVTDSSVTFSPPDLTPAVELELTEVGELHSLTDWQVSEASDDAELEDFCHAQSPISRSKTDVCGEGKEKRLGYAAVGRDKQQPERERDCPQSSMGQPGPTC